jgi:hypothetical protein
MSTALLKVSCLPVRQTVQPAGSKHCPHVNPINISIC